MLDLVVLVLVFSDLGVTTGPPLIQESWYASMVVTGMVAVRLIDA